MNKKNFWKKALVWLALIAVVCVAGYFVVFHNADILKLESTEKKIAGSSVSWLVTKSGDDYFKLAEVTTPTKYVAIRDAEDTDDDPLTTFFLSQEKEPAGETPVRFLIQPQAMERPDIGTLADEGWGNMTLEKKDVFLYPENMDPNAATVYCRVSSPLAGMDIEICATQPGPATLDEWKTLCANAVKKVKPGDEAYVLQILDKKIVGAKKSWLITAHDSTYIKLGDVNAPEGYTTVKEIKDLDHDPLTTFFHFSHRNTDEHPTEYWVYAQPQEKPDIGVCAGEGWGNVTLNGVKAFVYPENMDAAHATAVYCRIASPYPDIDIEIRLTRPEAAEQAVWLEECAVMIGKIEPLKQLSPIAADFKLNFLDEDRWEQLLSGLGVTLKITFFATLLGIVIGVLVAVVRSTWDKTGETMRPGIGRFLLKILNSFCKFYLTIIRGTPVVIQLLLAYYVILINTHDGVMVAILSFGINSGAYVAEIIRAGIQSVDNGQFEAGRSLGFNYVSTMWHIIVPQAFKNVLPSLANEFIVLLKETSVAGYVAVKDLTKEGDLIRGTTFSAFMPLIAVAVIYLIIVMFFTWLVGKLERRLRNSDH